MVVSVYMTVEFGKTIKVWALGNSEVVHSTSFYKSTCESVKLLTFGFFGCELLRLPGYLLALGRPLLMWFSCPGSFPIKMSVYTVPSLRCCLTMVCIKCLCSFQYELGFKSVRDISEGAIGPQTSVTVTLEAFNE